MCRYPVLGRSVLEASKYLAYLEFGQSLLVSTTCVYACGVAAVQVGDLVLVSPWTLFTTLAYRQLL
jgi:hypothetical protein